MTVGDRLNELLEAERAGVETLSRLFPEARSPEHSSRRSGTTRRAGSCTRLARSIKFLACQRTRHIANIEACERS